MVNMYDDDENETHDDENEQGNDDYNDEVRLDDDVRSEEEYEKTTTFLTGNQIEISHFI